MAESADRLRAQPQGGGKLSPDGTIRESGARAQRTDELRADDPGYGALLSRRAQGPHPVQCIAAPNRTGLPDRLKEGVEALSGISLDRVKVHYNSSRPSRLDALAYAQGSNIHVAPGQEKHLPHEAWHLVQQAQGRVRPTAFVRDGLAINAAPALEAEADRMGALAAGHVATSQRTPSREGAWNHATAQPMFRVMNLFRPVAAIPFPGRTPGPGTYPTRLPIYRLDHLFSGYKINGTFKAVPKGESCVDINYIEKGEGAQGFRKLFEDIATGAQEVGSVSVAVEFDQCKPQVVEKIEKYAAALGFEEYERLNDEEIGGTGPTIRLRKKIPPKSEDGGGGTPLD
jgi:hypothetical protein